MWASRWHACQSDHTLLAGLLYRGTTGFSRAQTVQILTNSLALELVVLCLQYTEDSSDASEASVSIDLAISSQLHEWSHDSRTRSTTGPSLRRYSPLVLGTRRASSQMASFTGGEPKGVPRGARLAALA